MIDIIQIASIVSGVLVIGGVVVAIIKWVIKQENQDDAIKHIKAENKLLCEGVIACLDGLEQLGCNHSVPVAKKRLSEYLNDEAHRI